MKKIICLLSILILSFSCKPKELVGTYVANHDNGSDTLILNKDSTFIHNFVSKEGDKFFDKGRWEMGEEQGYIDFENFNFHLKGYDKPVKDSISLSYWGVEVEHSFKGEPYLVIDADRGWKYQWINNYSSELEATHEKK